MELLNLSHFNFVWKTKGTTNFTSKVTDINNGYDINNIIKKKKFLIIYIFVLLAWNMIYQFENFIISLESFIL